MAQYKYSPLTLNNIRLVTLCPGDHRDDIQIIIEHEELIPECMSPQSLPRLMTTEELGATLPPDWSVYETVEDELCFFYETADGKSWKSSSFHPDPSIDASRYLNPNLPMSGIRGPSYEALSYTWRSDHPDEDAKVKANDEKQATTLLRIGGNLASALRSLRHRDTARTLWIDAISIDQTNLEERKQQVARMAAIYKNASRVVVWLGASSVDSTLAIKTLGYLGQQVIFTKDNWLLTRPGGVEGSWCESKCILPYVDEVWTAIDTLLSRPWFARIWIVQEIQLARKGAVVRCGQEQIPWSRFRSAITCLWVSYSPNHRTLRHILSGSCPQNKHTLPQLLSREKLRFVDYLANTFHVNTSVSHLLHLVRGRRCGDDHDYVYGVLGLLPAALQTVIIPSYEKTIAETYTNFTISCIEQQKHLNILRDCGRESRNQQHWLPSWVPDLSSTDKWTNPIKWHNAAGDSEAEFEILGQGLLRVSGVECGTVTFTEERCHGSSGARVKRLMELCRVTESSDDLTGSQECNMPLNTFCRTLAGGYLRDRFPDHTLPSLQNWKAAVTTPDYLQSLFAENYNESQFKFHEQWVSDLLQRRNFFQTDVGSIALGPSGVKQG